MQAISAQLNAHSDCFFFLISSFDILNIFNYQRSQPSGTLLIFLLLWSATNKEA